MRLPRLTRPSLEVHSGRMMARTLGAIVLTGSLAAAVWLALPHPAAADEVPLGIVIALSALVGILLLSGRFDGRSERFYSAVLGLGTLAISAEVYFSHVPYIGLALFYLWATPYAFCWLRRRPAAVHIALVGAAYAVVLLLMARRGEVAYRHAPGIWVLLMSTVLTAGLLVRTLTVSLRRQDALLRSGFEKSTVPMALVGDDFEIAEVNRAFCRLVGRPREELLAGTFHTLHHPDDVERNHQVVERVLAGDASSASFETRMLRSDGSVIWAELDVTLITDGGRRLLYSQVHDITDRRRTQEKLARQARQQAAVAELGRQALTNPDLDVLFTQVVKTVAKTLDVELAKVMRLCEGGTALCFVAGRGWHPDVVRHVDLPSDGRTPSGRAIKTGDPVVVTDASAERRVDVPEELLDLGLRSGISVVIRGREAPWGVLAVHSRSVRDYAPDEVDFLVSVANVVSSAIQRHHGDETLRHRALHDALTGLPNRTLALDRLRHALSLHRREHGYVGVLLLDVDGFKVVNDSLGHNAGDEVLKTLAPRLRAAARDADTVARLGGDEFIVVCERLHGPRDAIEIAERLQRAVARPMQLETGEHVLSASIGIALTEVPGRGADELVRDADAAMYRAKEKGRGRYELFDAALRARVVERLRVEHDLRGALERDELRVWYQPIVSVKADGPLAVEALVRWQDPRRGLITPDAFVNIAEETGLITRVGDAVLRQAVRDVARWQHQFATPLQVCVNASGRQLAYAGFASDVSDVVRRGGLAPGTLALEITESVLVGGAASPIPVLTSLREHGLRLMLDDFGTGYSSLSYLKRFPVDALKIDQSFIRDIADPDDAAIVEAIIKMAHTVGLTTVAEGVETTDQLQRLRSLGCRRAQGFLFAAPMPAPDLEEFLRERLPGRHALAR